MMNFVDDANDFINEGFNPIPTFKNKNPRLEKGHNFFKEPIDKVEERFANCGGIALCGGMTSSGFMVIDFDNEKFPKGHKKHKQIKRKVLKVFMDFCNDEIVAELISSGKVAVAKTPSGGRHIYLKVNKQVKSKKLARWSSKMTMIETKAQGGYVLVPPSVGYEYVNKQEILKLDYITDQEWEHLIERAISMSEIIESKDNNVNTIQENGMKVKRMWSTDWNNSTPDGRYNNENGAEIPELLASHGWTYMEDDTDGVQHWCRPDKDPEDGVSATFGRFKYMFYVFSSNAEPFDQDTGYTPFQVYTILKHGGNWKKAKDQLRDDFQMKPFATKVEPVQKSYEVQKVDLNGSGPVFPDMPHKEEPEVKPKKVNKFPVDVFPEFIQKFFEDMHQGLGFNPDFTAAALLFNLGTICGNRYKVQVLEGWVDAPIVWIMALGRPGTMKSHPMAAMINPLIKIDEENVGENKRALQEWEEDESKKKGAAPQAAITILKDYTQEAMKQRFEHNPRGLGVYRDEIKGLFGDMNKYRGGKGSDQETLLTYFNNTSDTIVRKTQAPVIIKNICLSLTGTIQPDVLRKIVENTAENGLVDRFLFTEEYTHVRKFNRRTQIDPDMMSKYRESILKMSRDMSYRLEIDTQIIKLCDPCLDIFETWYNSLVDLQTSDHISQRMINYTEKMKTYVPRFALILALADKAFNEIDMAITTKHMTDAIRMAKYFMRAADNVFTEVEDKMESSALHKKHLGKTFKEQIIGMHLDGATNKQIIDQTGKRKQYVSDIIRTYKKGQ